MLHGKEGRGFLCLELPPYYSFGEGIALPSDLSQIDQYCDSLYGPGPENFQGCGLELPTEYGKHRSAPIYLLLVHQQCSIGTHREMILEIGVF